MTETVIKVGLGPQTVLQVGLEPQTVVATTQQTASASVAETVVKVAGAPGPKGPKGQPGINGASFVTLNADQPVGGHRVIRATATGCDYASASEVAHMGTVIGVTLGAWDGGVPADIYTRAEVVEPSWAFAVGPVYLGDNGLLTQIPPTAGFVQQVATALAATRIIFEIQPPIRVI